jgi:hypothetical protein
MSIGRRRIQPKPSPESSHLLSSSGNYNSVEKRSTRPLSTGVGQRIKSNAFSKEATWERRRRPIRRDLGFHPQTKDQDEEKEGCTMTPPRRGMAPTDVIIVGTGEPDRDFARNQPSHPSQQPSRGSCYAKQTVET